MTQTLPILIVGGGLAGLATAALLRARDIETVVLESNSSVGGPDRLEPAWVFQSKEANISAIRAEAKLPPVPTEKLQLKVVTDRAGNLGIGTMGFVMKTDSSSMLNRMSIRGTLSASAISDVRLTEFYKSRDAGDGQDLLCALSGVDAAETRTSPRGAFALARALVLEQESIIGFDGGCARWIDECAAAAGTIQTNCTVESLLLEDGRARGVLLASGEELLAKAVVLAEPAHRVRALFTGGDWMKVPAEERWKFEAASPRPALRIQYLLSSAPKNPIFAFCHEPPSTICIINNRAWVKVGIPVDGKLDEMQQKEIVASAAKAVEKLHRGVSTEPGRCDYTFFNDDEPIAALAGARERPHHAIDGFDNLLIVGASADAEGFGLERTLGSARIVARKL